MKYSLFAIIFLVISAYFFYVPTLPGPKPEAEAVPTNDYYCPASKYVDAFGERWTTEFWAANPDATIEDWTVAWNQIARAMKCSIYVRTPEEAQRTLDIRGKLP